MIRIGAVRIHQKYFPGGWRRIQLVTENGRQEIAVFESTGVNLAGIVRMVRLAT